MTLAAVPGLRGPVFMDYQENLEILGYAHAHEVVLSAGRPWPASRFSARGRSEKLPCSS